MFIPQHATTVDGLERIRHFGIGFFRAHVLRLPRQQSRQLVNLIDALRLVESVTGGEQCALVGRLVDMFRAVGEYDMVEQMCLEATRQFYTAEAQGAVLSLGSYLSHATRRLEYEAETIAPLLAPSTKGPLVATVEKALVADRLDCFFPSPAGSSLEALFAGKEEQSLRLLYRLVDRVFAVGRLGDEWSAFVRAEGHRVMGTGPDGTVIARVIAFRERIDAVIRDCFDGNATLRGTLKDAFESFFNVRQDRAAELLALHLHHCLQQSLSAGEGEGLLTMALLLFRYLQGKDAFEGFFKRTLAQRLLFNLSGDLALERQFVARLREECGGVFTSRMEGMLKDVDTSGELTRAFRARGGASATSGIGSVTTLTVVSGLWPVAGDTHAPVTLPTALARLETSFADFYVETRRNCSLTWNERMGSCVMRGHFATGSRDLVLTVPQALVLLQFNGRDSVSLGQLATALKMDRGLVEETVRSLTSAAYPVLLVERDTVAFNAEFACRERRAPLFLLQSPFLAAEDGGVVSPAMSTVSVPLASASVSSVISDRQFQVDALLMRRMKTVRQCLQADLINYVLATLKNVPVSAENVAGRISSLIERMFIEVAEDKTLVYLP